MIESWLKNEQPIRQMPRKYDRLRSGLHPLLLCLLLMRKPYPRPTDNSCFAALQLSNVSLYFERSRDFSLALSKFSFVFLCNKKEWGHRIISLQVTFNFFFWMIVLDIVPVCVWWAHGVYCAWARAGYYVFFLTNFSSNSIVSLIFPFRLSVLEWLRRFAC